MNKMIEDLKEWCAISCPVNGLRFDKRTLEFLDADHDGFIRSDEVKAAIRLVQEKGEGYEASEEKLAELMARENELDKLEPPNPEVEKLISAANRLAAVEKIVDGYFLPAEDAPLVLEEEVKPLPLNDKVNVRYLDEMDAFVNECVKPTFGEKAAITFREWRELKAKYIPYRGASASAAKDGSEKAKVIEEEKLCRYKLYLDKFLENYVTMDALTRAKGEAMFQVGTLRIAGREMTLVFQVENEAAHSALSGKSNCYVIYLKLTQAGTGKEQAICAVVTAGTVAGLYVGRNGVFYDRDGGLWAAIITKVVENQVSLLEAFWSPWRKVGETISGAVKKFLGDKHGAALTSVTGATNAQAGGAALASSVAAIGIGVGMVGAAFASLLAAVKGMSPTQWLISLLAVVLVVSLPSVVLTWFKLRQRDIGAILNAGGWAINRKLSLSMKRAGEFTRCAKDPRAIVYGILLLIVFGALIGTAAYSEYHSSLKGEITNEQTEK